MRPRCQGFAGLVWLTACLLYGADDLGVRAPLGFEVRLYADDELAHDIYTLTTDPHGRVVVSGAGYIKILVDRDGDGRADAAQVFAEGPLTGAQGLCWHGRDLLCVGDAGVIRYRDADGDDRADGPPETLLAIRTGGEHHAHALRQGPDGYFYLLAGNDTGVDAALVTAGNSPIRSPEAGVLLRLSPDFKVVEVVADGFRNAYDFDFHASGGIFVYDSDDERDVSLPWYRPTRLFEIVPGAHAGWVTRSWKRLDYFADMAPVVASFGRGSPTGVVCYRHRHFPAAYRGAFFLADWTFGRVYSVRLQPDPETARWSADATPFLTNTGQFGFAPTDLEVAPDGALYVSVGGRGTRGGVFRVSWQEAAAPMAAAGRPNAVLDADQPLASWSRAQWQPLAASAGRLSILQAALDDRQMPSARCSAIEILTEQFGGLGRESHAQLRLAPAEVRARAAWSLGRRPARADVVPVLTPYLQDADAQVVRSALESLLALSPIEPRHVTELAAPLRELLAHRSSTVRQLVARVLARDERCAGHVLANQTGLGPLARVTVGLSQVERASAPQVDVFRQLVAVWRTTPDPDTRLAAVRVLQLALADVGPRSGRPPVFDGYAPRIGSAADDLRDLVARQVAVDYPTGHADCDRECERLFAMLELSWEACGGAVLAGITAESHPTDDIHRLLVTVRLRGPRQFGEQQRERIAAGIVAVEGKVATLGLHQDRNWVPRWEELFRAWLERDAGLASSIVRQPAFGQAGHAVFVKLLPASAQVPAIDAIVARLRGEPADDEEPWPAELLFALAESQEERHHGWLRAQAARAAPRDAALAALARLGQPADRALLYEGLVAGSLETTAACLSALERFPPPQEGHEFAALVAALQRLEGDRPTYETRERVARLLQAAVSESLGFVYGPEGHCPQPEAIGRWREWVEREYPESAGRLVQAPVDLVWLDAQLEQVRLLEGNAERGHALFRRKACVQCHSGRNALGPDLAGVTRRFSPRDLFLSIAFPSLNVSPRYRTIVVETVDGKLYQGAIVYDAVDGLTLVTSANQTVRIDGSEIVRRADSSLSLMPNGLLTELTPSDYADLYQYLDSLGK